jgi:hypothetical protein
MLAKRGNHLSRRLRQPQPRRRLPIHASLQVRNRLTAKRCGAGAKPLGGCVVSGEPTSVGEAVRKRCGASAVTIAQASSARDAEKIEKAMTTR